MHVVSSITDERYEGYIPGDDLASHLVARVREVSCETEISDFELAICSNKQVVWLQILRNNIPSEREVLGGLRREAHSVKDEVPVAEFEPAERHCHPALDVSWQEY